MCSGNVEGFPAPEITGRKSLGCRAASPKDAMKRAGHGRDEPKIAGLWNKLGMKYLVMPGRSFHL